MNAPAAFPNGPMGRQVFRSIWERRLGRTESPIKALFLEQFCQRAAQYWCIGAREVMPNDTIVIKPQAAFDRYRVDFLISYHFFGSTLELIVECDGHEFHERTKAQAARDRRRDRDLQRLGIKVFRFTGSELRRDAAGCADEVIGEISRFQTECCVSKTEPVELGYA